MEFIQSVVLGVVQGIAEFLPISSSAHLVLVPYLLGWDYKGLGFDVALHFGTTLAILVYFWKDWVFIVKNAFRAPSGPSVSSTSSLPKNILWQILIATIPAGIAGYFLADHIEAWFHSPLLIAINLAVFGVILWLVDKAAASSLSLCNINFKRSILVGIAQCLALVPGVSRSGITIVTSRSLGLNRPDAARFSFLLSTPAVIGAFLFSLKDIERGIIDFYFIFAVALTAIVGYFAIKYLIAYLSRKDMSAFAIYRFVLAALIVAVYLIALYT